VYPLTLHACLPTRENVDGAAEAKADKENATQLSPVIDAPPESLHTDVDSVAASNQLAIGTPTPLIDPSHESATASQINALHAALQDNINANTAMRETMQESNRALEAKLECIEAFMTIVSDRLGAIEQVVVERHDAQAK